MKGGKVKFLQAAPRADLRPQLETPPCAVAVAGAFLFTVAGAPNTRKAPQAAESAKSLF